MELYHRRDLFPYTTLPSACTSMYQFMCLKPSIAAVLHLGGILSALQSNPQLRDKLLNFLSFHPFINKTNPYPLVHPKAGFENFDTLMACFGTVRANIYPLHGPFFPCKSKASYLFPHATLALKSARPPAPTDEERAHEGT